ncbi:MAG: short-chain dehydrogenase [Planctomycetaceae bacterium]|nr:short-chain dehydrogenase [Planctomycetaceae bacterium]
MLEDIQGKKVLVSGAGTGIGRGIALGFAEAGASVALHYSHSGDGAASAAKEINDAGGKAKTFQADFSDAQEVLDLGKEALAWLGGMDALVNNAGITFNRAIEETTVEQYDRLYSVNVRAPYFLSQAVVPTMSKQGSGSIINLSSVHAFEGMTHHSVYAGTRGAIKAFTRQLAIELAPRGIRVNAIAPGAIFVENYLKAMPDFEEASLGSSIPAGFVGAPRDIANMAIYLASDAARFILGQTILVDGGTTSWMPFSEDFKEAFGGQFGQGYVPGT